MQRVEWIDSIKGIGILLIMLSHSYSCGQIGHYLFFGYIPLFFICSGFTINTQIVGGVIVQKRLRRLGKSYLVWGTKVMLFTYFFFDVGIIHSLEGLLYSRYCLYPLGAANNVFFLRDTNTSTFWFLTCMMLAYVWFAVYLKLREMRLVLGVYFLLTLLFSRLPLLLPWSLDTSFLATIFIVVGYEIKKENFRLLYMKKKIYIACFLVFLLVVYYNGAPNMSVASYGRHHLINVPLFALGSFLYTILLARICIWTEKSKFSTVMATIGKYSLQLMCIHLFCFALFRKIVYTAIGYYSESFLISLVMILFVTYGTVKIYKMDMVGKMRLLIKQSV